MGVVYDIGELLHNGLNIGVEESWEEVKFVEGGCYGC